MPLQLENTPCPLPTLHDFLSASDDDDIDDSDSDDDLSPILDAMTGMTVSSHVFCASLILMPFHSPLDYPNSTESC